MAFTFSLLKYSRFCIFLCCSFWASQMFAASKTTINILTWWGYLDIPEAAQLIHEKCNAELAHDNYRSNDDLIRKWNSQKNKYDVIIFADTMYSQLKDDIYLPNSKLHDKAEFYYPLVKKRYLELRYPPNVAFFAQTMTGFLWNPDVIELSKNDTIAVAFAKAKSNIVIIVDNPVEINMLLAAGLYQSPTNTTDFISYLNLKQLTLNSQVYISSETNKLYSASNFAFAYAWSGGALYIKDKIHKNFKFLVDEHLSYISSDLIAQLKDNPAAACAVNILASKEFLFMLHKKTFYFSPYGDISTLPEGEYKTLYQTYLTNILKLQWTNPN